MKSTALWALIVINAALAAAFLGRVLNDNSALAQQAQARRPGDYVMIPGEVAGGPSGLVYMLDTTNGILGAITYDDTRREIGVMPSIDLNRVFEAAATAQPQQRQQQPARRP